MKREIRQMMAEWIRPPKNMVKSQSHPHKRLVLGEMKAREHPSKLGPPKPLIGHVVHKYLVVPIDETVLEDGGKRPKGDQDDANQRNCVKTPARGLVCGRSVAVGFGCS